VSEIRLLIVPYELGALRQGVGRGPERLLERGAEQALRTQGAELRTEVVEIEGDFDNEVDASFELIREISLRVKDAVADGAFPVVLSGSCYAAVGIVAGLGESSPGVVWFDAHADFNTPETTISGYFDGMGLAVLTGGAWQAMLETVEGARPLPETAAVLAGARDFDEPEIPRLQASSIAQVPPDSLRSPEPLLGAVAEMTPSPSRIYVHVDLDVLDIEEARVNIYSAPGGLSAAELESGVDALLTGSPVRAISLTAYDPECDVDARVPPIAMRILERVRERLAAG
jgi:arginase